MIADTTLGLIIFGVSFSTTLLLTPKLITFLKRIGLMCKDIHKEDNPKIPEMGLTIPIGFISGAFTLVTFKVFFNSSEILVPVFGAISTILLITIIGIIDDLEKMEEWKGGWEQWQKPLLTLPAVIPLVAIKAGFSTMFFPLIGTVDFGIWFPLLIVPIGLVGATNSYNMLAGLNGLESGMGAVISFFLAVFSLTKGLTIGFYLSTALLAACLAFYFFNKYPSAIFPGDVGTYTIGASIASIVILSNMEKLGVVLFLPYILEFFIKAKNRFKTECFGKLKNGKLKAEKIGSLTHFIMRKGDFTEEQVVNILLMIEILIGTVAFVVFT